VEFRKPGTVSTPGTPGRPGSPGLGPFKAYAALVGLGARTRVPTPLRETAYRAFARATGADLSEAELPLAGYRSLGELFARRLRPGARTIDPDPDAVIAPCDGAIAALGSSDGGELIQAKGKTYTLDELVVDEALARRLRGGWYITIYLSPRNYHRVHAPLDGRIVSYDYVPGALWPVNPRLSARRDRLLARNERVVIGLEDAHGRRVAVVMVGAAGVGNLALAHLPEGASAPGTLPWRAAGERRRIELDAPVARGDELGAFQLGSTVVLAFEPGAAALAGLELGREVRFGERLGEAV
jgi:phosphatidylserine decarboxylase